MQANPFSFPGLGSPGKSGSSRDEIFSKNKFGGAGRRAAPAEALEPMDMAPAEAAPEPEKKQASVVLRNPKWEAEKVGFNEEAKVSVELELPPEHAHKTKVAFELFANTPKGPERISQGEGKADAGKALGTVPVYIPTYKDEDGNLMAKVEYYFTAKHSESDPLDGSKVPKLVKEMAERLIKTHILPDITFGFGKSSLSGGQAEALKTLCGEIKSWRAENPEGKLAVFGHADAVGKAEYNKGLSERRAKAVFGFLMKDPQAWEDLQKEEKWGLAPIQEFLKHCGEDPGACDGKDGPKTQAAVKGFQGKHGLAEDGVAGADTRKALFQAFMDECNDLELKTKDFDDVNGSPHAGCSEFNLVEKTEGASAANRRVTVLLLKSNKNFPITYPCQKGDVGPCKKQVARKGERRTAGFGCCFYDKLVTESAKPGEDVAGVVKIGLPIYLDPSGSGSGKGRVKVVMGGETVQDLGLQECEQGEDGLVYISIEDPQAGDLYTVSVAQGDRPEQVVIQDYEFHRYLKGLLEGSPEFERPEISALEPGWIEAEDADGAASGDEPYELDRERLAGMHHEPEAVFA